MGLLKLGKRIKDMKFAIARFLNRNPRYCWSDLVMWALGYEKWYDLILAEEWVYKLWFTEVILWVLRKDVFDAPFNCRDYQKTDDNYCMKCVYVDKRKDGYAQARVRVQKRGDKRVLEM